jgi:hypothetical protein
MMSRRTKDPIHHISSTWTILSNSTPTKTETHSRDLEGLGGSPGRGGGNKGGDDGKLHCVGVWKSNKRVL